MTNWKLASTKNLMRSSIFAAVTISAMVFPQACYGGSSLSSDRSEVQVPQPTLNHSDVTCSNWEKGAVSVPSPYSVAGIELNKSFADQGVESNYHVFAKDIDFSKPVRVVVRLHGDGAREYNVPDGLTTCLANVANQHNAIYVVPKSPDRQGTETWWEDIPRNRAWLGALLQREIYPRFGLTVADSVWMGYSGGAELITYGILPYHPEWIGQSATMVGGGGAPHRLYAPVSPDQLKNVELTWTTGLDDDGRNDTYNALASARAGAQFYRGAGFVNVIEDYPAAYNHYNVPQIKALEQKLSGQTIKLG